MGGGISRSDGARHHFDSHAVSNVDSGFRKLVVDCHNGRYQRQIPGVITYPYGKSDIVRMYTDCKTGRYQGHGKYGTSSEVRMMEACKNGQFRSGTYGLTTQEENSIKYRFRH